MDEPGLRYRTSGVCNIPGDPDAENSVLVLVIASGAFNTEERDFPSATDHLQHRTKGQKRWDGAAHGTQRGFSRAGTRDAWTRHTAVSSRPRIA
ncbi:hypothetical protein R6Z07F_000189 [Ovis aries]